jgi:hypothetical protein
MIFSDRFYDLFATGRGAYLGYHGFASYVSSVYPFWRRTRVFRYQRGVATKPLEQLTAHLQAQPNGVFALRTDSGGNYGTVRASLIDMAIATGRPLVAARQTVDRFVTIGRHFFPLPGSTVTTRLSEPLTPAAVAALPREAARLLLQQRIDALVADDRSGSACSPD